MQMSDCIHRYPAIVLPWDAYPRAHYFRGRFLDLNTRFKRIIGALPKVLHNTEMMDDIEELNKMLANKYNHITVYGKENLHYKDLYVGKSEDINQNFGLLSPCLTLTMCCATIESLDDSGLHQILAVILHASKSTELENSLLVVCKTKSSFPEPEITEFRAKLRRLVYTTVNGFSKNFEILVSETSDLKDHISAFYERRIIQAFSCIHSYLNIFAIGNTQCVQNKISVLTDGSIIRQLRDYLNNRFSMSDINKAIFRTQLIARLVRVFKCTIISPMSSKYCLPHWLCNRLLHEIKYEEALIKSVSANTTDILGKLERVFTPVNIFRDVKCNDMPPCTKLSKCSTRNFLVKSVQKDFTDTTAKAEKVLSSMESLTTVMRKIMFEIKGYQNQTIIHDTDTMQMYCNMCIPDDLRQEILLIRGVYGMGTIYDQLEIHVEEHSEARIAELMERLKILTKRHRFPYSYTIKCIKE